MFIHSLPQDSLKNINYADILILITFFSAFLNQAVYEKKLVLPYMGWVIQAFN